MVDNKSVREEMISLLMTMGFEHNNAFSSFEYPLLGMPRNYPKVVVSFMTYEVRLSTATTTAGLVSLWGQTPSFRVTYSDPGSVETLLARVRALLSNLEAA